MSHILSVYALDLQELEAVVGSGDEALLNRILAKFPAMSESAAGGAGSDRVAALRAVIAGGPFTERGERYVEALEEICQELGEDVGDVNFWFGYEGLPDFILDLATNQGYDGPIPDSDDNGWGSMSKRVCAEVLARPASMLAGEDELDDDESADGETDSDDEDFEDDDSDEEDEEYREAILEWCRASKEAGKDLIGFWAG